MSGASAAAESILVASPSRQGVARVALRFARPHGALLVGAMLLSIGASLASILAPVLVGRITDALLAAQGDRAVLLAALGVALAIVHLALSAVGRARLARGGEYLVRDVRDRIAAGLAWVPLRFVERHRLGDLLQRATAEVAVLSAFVRDSSTALLVTGATVVLFVIVLAWQSWLLALVLVAVFLPPSLFVMHWFRLRAAAASGAEAAAEADVAVELVESIRTRALLAAAPERTRRRLDWRASEVNERAVRAQMRTVVLARWISAVRLVEGVTMTAIVLLGVVLVNAGTVSAGVVVTFVLSGVALFASFSELVGLVGAVEEAATGAARAHDLLRATAPAEHGPEVDGGNRVAGRRRKVDGGRVRTATGIVLEDVWFDYGGDPVLRGVSLRLEDGVRYGLAGRSGAGKSTLALLLAGLYTPARGTVRCDGRDIPLLAPEDRAQLVAFVPQEVQLGAGTVADELRLAAPGATDERLRATCAAIGLRAWLDALPAGLCTGVGPQSPLSAGDRQLVGLVRVALRDCRLLVLDEATSDIDPDTAALVEGALDRLAAGRTIVVVAHRAATLARLDRIFDVHDGTATERVPGAEVAG